MKSKIFIIFTIMGLVLIPNFAYYVLAQDTECNKGEIFNETSNLCIPACGKGTVLDDSNQCVPICGEGATLGETGQCVPDEPFGGWSELNWIVFGIIVGIIVAAVGIIFTVDQRRKEQRREANELIQKYGNQLSEIVNEENDLKTKLDCALYTERFLDTLEQIAKLYHSDLLGDKVTNYFDNEFRYGRNLWKWYRKNVQKYPDYQLDKIEEELADVSKKYGKKKDEKPPNFFVKKFAKNKRKIFRDNFNKIYSHRSSFGEDDRWYNFLERCYWAQISAFKSQNILLTLEDRINYLTEKNNALEFDDNAIKRNAKTLKVLEILRDKLKEKLEIERKNNPEFELDDLKFDENEIRTILDIYFSEEIGIAEQLEYVRRYAEGAENKILPDIMELAYEEIPDENGLSNFEVLEIVQDYSGRIAELKKQERGLISKQDCAIYAEQYLDVVDEIASLYRQKLFPQSAITYFQNSFGYGLNLMNWYSKFVRKTKNPDFWPDDKITQEEIDAEEDRWIDLRWICRGGDSRQKKNRIYPFKDRIASDLSTKRNANGQFILPDPMYRYEELPDEEGIKPDDVLEIMKEYGDSLIKITEKERELRTQLDCALYVEQYLDILDQIAYLLNNNSIATDSSTFFENNFAFGLTLKIWYDLKVAGAKGQEGRWDEFLSYCNRFTDDFYKPRVLKAFRLVDVLPVAMLFVDKLPIDSNDETTNKQMSYKQEKEKIKEIPQIYYIWEEEYQKWQKHHEKLIKSWEGYQKWLEIQPHIIKSLEQYHDWCEKQDELTKSWQEFGESLEYQTHLTKSMKDAYQKWAEQQDELIKSWEEYEKWLENHESLIKSWEEYEKWLENHESLIKSWEEYEKWLENHESLIKSWEEYEKWLTYHYELIKTRKDEYQKPFENKEELIKSLKEYEKRFENRKRLFESNTEREDIQKFINYFKAKNGLDL